MSVRLFPSPAQEATAVADVLRRAHLIDGLAWSSMAVLVRSTRLAGPLQRALADAGVPVETPVDERPLIREPALEPLLHLLRVGAGKCRLDEETAVQLLCSPLGGADALDVRRLRRALHGDRARRRRHTAFRRAAGRMPVVGRSRSDVRRWVVISRLARRRRRRAAPDHGPTAHRARRGGGRRRLPSRSCGRCGRRAVGDRSSWTLCPGPAERVRPFSGTPTASSTPSSRSSKLRPGSVIGSRRRAWRSSWMACCAQEIPADPLSQRSFRGDAVRLLTAHRSKGLEWDLVVVPGVQEGAGPICGGAAPCWRATRSPGSKTSRLCSPPTKLSAAARASALVDERRLFYVAITRARRRLLVTAVSGGDDAELRPSRFLSELGVDVPAQVELAPRVLSLPALIAELRCVASDPEASGQLREAAVEELARLAPDRPGGQSRALVGAGVLDRSHGAAATGGRCRRAVAESGRGDQDLPAALVSRAACRGRHGDHVLAGLRHAHPRSGPTHRGVRYHQPARAGEAP